jgi:predicted dehydrogenase
LLTPGLQNQQFETLSIIVLLQSSTEHPFQQWTSKQQTSSIIMSNFLVIGAGSRGTAYAQAVTTTSASKPDSARIAAVVEPNPFKRAEFGRKFIWGTDIGAKPKRGQEFTDWREWIAWEDARRTGADSGSASSHPHGAETTTEEDVIITGVFVCTLDESHADVLRALAHLNLHVMCEKPLALSLADCLDIQAAYGSISGGKRGTQQEQEQEQRQRQRQQKIFSIGHVLRYSPHNTLLRRLLLQERVIGDVISLEHTEPVGWWHFAHSYVRGNWRHRTRPDGVGTLLTKSCHDIDFIMWLLSSPADPADPLAAAGTTKPHLPSTISSTGHLTHFKKARKPQAAGAATNCLRCPLGDEGCAFSAKKIYRDRWLRGERDTGWPLKIVLPEIENIVSSDGWQRAEQALMDRLAEDYDVNACASELGRKSVRERGWYGRCVYESDNDVVDDQTVTISWDEEEEEEQQSQHPQNTTDFKNNNDTTTTNKTTSTTTHTPKTALFHLTFATAAQCDRRGRIYGSRGEIAYDSTRITVYTFADDRTVEHVPPKPSSPAERKAHGGGDGGLVCAFVDAVEQVESGRMGVREAQRRIVGADVEEMVRSHAVVFAAEEARSRGVVVDFREWWGRMLGCGGG